MTGIAVVYLVDRHGRVLLQHRTDDAPRAPGLWGMVGGHVEPGEDHDTAVLRELEEETGIRAAPGDLERWREERFAYSDGHAADYAVYAGASDLTDADIVLGEGQAIVFVEPSRALGLPMAESNAHFLPQFLRSTTYRRLAGEEPA